MGVERAYWAFGCPLVLLLVVSTVSESPQVVLPGQGTLQGSTTTTAWSQRLVYQFQGIPFAEPPVGPRRFKPPEPASPWEGVLDARQFRRVCPVGAMDQLLQFRFDDESNLKDSDIEDCLHINVYTPTINVNANLPVMVYIHGGSFRVGSARNFKPDYLLQEDIVLVVPQYRLGPLGFLSLQTDEVPGNVGLMDQVLALRWVQLYIRYFGGDPRQVTVFGQSAGGAAVTLMLVSPLVNSSLFTKLIVQSGSALSTWVLDIDPVPHARGIASFANCTQEDLDNLTSCLRDLPAQTILDAHSSFLVSQWQQYRRKSDPSGTGERGTGGNHAVLQTAGTEKFLVEDPMESIKAGRYLAVPMMAGVTQHEGSFILRNYYTYLHYFNFEDRDFLTHNITRDILDASGIDDTTGMITQVFQEKYFKKGELGNFSSMVPGLMDICGVSLLKASVLRSAQENNRLAPTFLYSFNYKGNNTLYDPDEESRKLIPEGVAHSDDLLYLFPHKDKEVSGQDVAVAETMVKLWTSFAITGIPSALPEVLTWPRMTGDGGPYLRITKNSVVRENFLDEFMVAVNEGFEPLRSSNGHNTPFKLATMLLTGLVVRRIMA